MYTYLIAILSLFYSDRFHAVTNDLVGMLPKYWKHVAASSSKLQFLLSAADMLAATKEIDFDFDRMIESINEEVAKREQW